MNTSQENDYQIIESYCVLSGEKDKSASKNFESKIDNHQVEDFHNHFKISSNKFFFRRR